MTKNDNTVYILDSYGLIFRCYFAFISRPLTNSRGENVSALFGFFRNLHWILQHYKPGYLFAAMDSKTKTFRHEMYPEYKATRNKTPEDLHAQIPWICDILETLGVPVLQCDGYEADDVIATVAKKCSEQGRQCRILSGDKDLMQLVNDTTLILKPESGAQTWKLTDAQGVEAEWGVPPSKLLDLLSLYGDTADNVPGVHGVGVKTASKLLTDYNDLDGIYAHISEIKGAMQQKLADGKDDAYFSQKLIRLFDTVPCSDIDAALSADPLTFNYKAAADKLMAYGAPVVAKSYAELSIGGGSLPLGSATVVSTGSTTTSSPTPSNGGHPRNAPDVGGEALPINLKQNDTSSYKPITDISDLEKYISAFLKSSDKKSSLPTTVKQLRWIPSTAISWALVFVTSRAKQFTYRCSRNQATCSASRNISQRKMPTLSSRAFLQTVMLQSSCTTPSLTLRCFTIQALNRSLTAVSFTTQWLPPGF